MPNELSIKFPITGSKRRIKFEFGQNHLSLRVHKDTIAARERIYKKFRGQYDKQELDSFSYLAFEKLLKATKLEKGDDLPTELGI
jgi:hypothetical protein